MRTKRHKIKIGKKTYFLKYGLGYKINPEFFKGKYRNIVVSYIEVPKR